MSARSSPQLLALALTASLSLNVSAQVGSNFCSPAPNSTGVAATLSGAGSDWVSLGQLTLTSTQLPTNVGAHFLCSRSQAFVANPGGSAGNLCLGAPIGRAVGGVVLSSGAAGTVSAVADLAALPQPNGAVAVQPGETWSFQCWYRDAAPSGGATSNFSVGLEVLFTAGGQPLPGLRPIPAGTFSMGSDAANTAPYFNGLREQPVHPVTISNPFWMGEFEVTQAEYQALMGVNPSLHLGADRPVERLSWFDARAYCAALNAQEAGHLPPGYEYRLPTEAEWEYACRAGSTTEFHFGPALLCSDARFSFSYHSNASCGLSPGNGSTVSVGSFAPNAFGLYDMHGNVSEWCLDSYAPYSGAAPVSDPFATGGTDRVHRGGSWGSNSDACRSARRLDSTPGGTGSGLGFRVVLAPVLVP